MLSKFKEDKLMLSTLYYYGGISKMDFDFCKAPKQIFKSEKLKKLSPHAKLLYIALMDRLSLSIKNGWVDKTNRYYVNYTVRDAMNELDCCVEKAIKTFAELDVKSGIGLIERKRVGFGKPAIIYIYNLKHVLGDEKTENNLRISTEPPKQCETELCSANICDTKNDTSENVDVNTSSDEIQELRATEPNNNNINKNNFNKIYMNKNHSVIHRERENDGFEKRNVYKKVIENNISYEKLKTKIPNSRLNEIVNVIVSALCSNKTHFKINGEIVSYEHVKERFMLLESEHIEYVYNSIEKITEPISNINSYLISALYRSDETLSLWMDNQNHLVR